MNDAPKYREMFFQRLGKSGLWVSDVGLGTWKLGYPELGDGSRVQPGQALRIMDRAAELGCVFWDTADRYNFGTGNAERIMGQWFARNPSERTNIVLATKVCVQMNGETPNHQGLSRRHIIEGVECCLERLNVDCIDLLQFHQADPGTPAEESVRAIDDLIRQGIVQYWGVSNFTVEQLQDFLRAGDKLLCTRMISVQNSCNVIDGEDPERPGVLEFCAEQGLGFLPWGTLARGLATDRYLDATKVGPGDRIYDEGDLDKVRTDRAVRIVETLQRIGAKHEKSVAQTALAYLLSQPGMGAVIPSASTVEQLEQNCAASGYRLFPDELADIEKARATK